VGRRPGFSGAFSTALSTLTGRPVSSTAKRAARKDLSA
jgi:hypothetical protein